MNRLRKIVLVLGILAGFVFLGLLVTWVAMPAWDIWMIWRVYSGYVETVSNLTGLNRYLVTAGALLMFVPFYYGATQLLSFSRRKRYIGGAILMVLAVLYNLSLYQVTKEMSFAFSGGAPQKWYALTPEGVKFYDRPGVDTTYGIPLKPVTPEVIRKLKLLQQGEFKPIDPSRATFFNPITGEAQVWYYKYPDGSLEFYDKPGFHPVTGTPLQPVTQEVYFEWGKTQKSKQPTASVGEMAPGVRQSGGKPPSGVAMEVRSDPQGAEAYLDWKPKGQTPVALEGKEVRGLLVVMKEGHQAGFRKIDTRGGEKVEFTLPPEGKRSRTRLLLTAPEGTSNEATSSLRSRLVEEGFTVLGPEEAREFQQELTRAGGLSHRGFRAWARARFDTDLLLTARVRQSSRELSDQELGYLGIREAVKGAVRTEVGIDLEIVDLRSGDHVTAVSAKGAGFALDRTDGFQKALSQAASESAKQLRQRIRG